jgi:hypothetical protein
MKPSKVEFEIGKDSYDRRVTLTYSTDYQGRQNVEITSHASGQRDDTNKIYSLTKDNILKAAEAIKLL